MAEKKVIFIAFAIEDQNQRDLLKGQSLNTKSPFEYVDMSVKEAYVTEWKEKVKTRIKRFYDILETIENAKNQNLTARGKCNYTCCNPGNDIDGISRFFSSKITPCKPEVHLCYFLSLEFFSSECISLKSCSILST